MVVCHPPFPRPIPKPTHNRYPCTTPNHQCTSNAKSTHDFFGDFWSDFIRVSTSKQSVERHQHNSCGKFDRDRIRTIFRVVCYVFYFHSFFLRFTPRQLILFSLLPPTQHSRSIVAFVSTGVLNMFSRFDSIRLSIYPVAVYCSIRTLLKTPSFTSSGNCNRLCLTRVTCICVLSKPEWYCVLYRRYFRSTNVHDIKRAAKRVH